VDKNPEWSGSPHISKGAEHNTLRTTQRTSASTIKYDISAETRVGYYVFNTDGNQLTERCVKSLIKLNKLRQLSIGIANVT
jgi:hypothetical protein